MNNPLLNALQEYFDAFFIQDDYRYFSRGLIQYIDFIKANPDLDAVLTKIDNIEKKDYAFFESLKVITLKEEEISEKKIRKIIKDNKLKSDILVNLLRKIDAHRNGLSIPYSIETLRNTEFIDSKTPVAWSSREFCFLLDDYLFEIAKEIESLGMKNLIKEFHDLKNVRHNIYGDWVFSYTYFQAIEELNRVTNERNGKIYDYYWIVRGALDFNPDSQNNLVKYDLAKYKFALQSLHIFIKNNVNSLSVPINPDNNDNIKFMVIFNENREIIIGGYPIKKFNFLSEREQVFAYVYNHPNEDLKREKIEKDLNISIKGTLPNIIKDAGFSDELKKIFFPSISNAGLRFRNPIYNQQYQSEGFTWTPKSVSKHSVA